MKYKINLLGKRINKGDIFKKINYFTINYLRYILVFTQLTVISVLFFRFTIDQSIIDLKDTIVQQEEIIKSVKPIIDESEILDSKLKNIKELTKNQEHYKQQIDYLLSIFPSSAFLSKFIISDEVTSMQGEILNLTNLQSFFNRLKSDKRYSEVDLGEIKRSEKGFSFVLSLNKFKSKL